MSHPHCHSPVWEVETLYSWGYYKYSQTQWTRGETHSSYERQVCTNWCTLSSMRMIVYFARCYFFIKNLLAGNCCAWRVQTVVKCAIMWTTKQTLDMCPWQAGSQAVLEKLELDDKKLVKSVNRGNWITLLLKDTRQFLILISKNTFEIPFIMKQITKPMSVSVPHRTSTASHLTVISLLCPELTNV